MENGEWTLRLSASDWVLMIRGNFVATMEMTGSSTIRTMIRCGKFGVLDSGRRAGVYMIRITGVDEAGVWARIFFLPV